MAVEETTFSRFFAVFSPAGSYRWRGGSEDAGLYNRSNLSIPYAAAMINAAERNNLLRRINATVNYAPPFGGLLLTFVLLSVLLYRDRLQTAKEPRFLIPVFLE